MKTRASTLALIALASSIDNFIQFDAPAPDDDDRKKGLVKTGAEVAGGAGLVGGGVLADRAIMKKYGQRSLLGTGEIKPGSPRSINTRMATDGVTTGGTTSIGRAGAYRQAASDIGNSVSEIGRTAKVAGRQAYNVARADGQGLLKSAALGGRKLLKVAVSKLSSRERLLALAAKADDLLAFDLTGGDHILRHIAGPLTPAIQGEKGKRLEGVKESGKHYLKNYGVGAAAGAGAGALLGAGIGALRASRGHFSGGMKPANRLASKMMVRESGHHIAEHAGAGVGAGLQVGALVGGLKGMHDKKARDIQEKYKRK